MVVAASPTVAPGVDKDRRALDQILDRKSQDCCSGRGMNGGYSVASELRKISGCLHDSPTSRKNSAHLRRSHVHQDHNEDP